MQAEINAFKLKFATLQRKGLPSFLTSNGKLLTHDGLSKCGFEVLGTATEFLHLSMDQ